MANYLKFWGTRGSCPVSGPEYGEFGGNTPSLELHYEDTLIIFDAGTGIRPLGITLKEVQKIDIFLSHFHWDHIVGFPFFEPIYEKGKEVTIWGPDTKHRTSKDLFSQLLGGEFFPIHIDQIQAKLNFKTITPGKPIQIGPITLDFHPANHPNHTVCFKIKTPKETIGYVTDNEIDLEKQESFISFFKGVDIFIHEAQYFPKEYEQKKGWGHSSLNNTIRLVDLVSPKRWIVTHYDPKHSDESLHNLENLALSHPPKCPVLWAKDGTMIELQ